MREIELIVADEAGIARAAALLRAGEVVAFPTETVYGLGADATDPAAVAQIYAAKGRPDFNPLIVHVADVAAADAMIDLPEAGYRLAAAFWPGPMTLVAPLRADAGIAPAVTAGLPTLAVRVPAHPVAQALMRATGRPLAAPSANRSGNVSPTAAAHVMAELGGRIAAVLDGGACAVGLESTIIGFDGARAVMLRPGGVPAEAVEEVLGTPLADRDASRITAPGQLSSHYAPAARLRLNADAPRPGELWLGLGPVPAGADGLSLSPAGDLAEAASLLFAHLRTLDARALPGQVIAVAPIPDRGLGRAINDRLMRAAAPR